MYSPSSFQVDDLATQCRFIEENPFATLISQLDGEPFATHIPFFLLREVGEVVLYGHMARANPQWQGFNGSSKVLVIFQGAHGYISPRWYQQSPAVPTWNYQAVHAYGCPQILESADDLSTLIAQQASLFETSPDWQYEQLSADYRQKMETHIVGFRLPVSRLEAKFKLSQNRTVAEQQQLISRLQSSDYAGDHLLAQEMQKHLFGS
ncbi:FMN-binding negative transcriptional regulator [Neisseriaceae bacterium TC5R-5]|nr:FMN-binding negative transcriptional regulator [Neisseriaceae bacterium TC5R-5]